MTRHSTQSPGPLEVGAADLELPASRMAFSESFKWLTGGMAVVFTGFCAYGAWRFDSPAAPYVALFDAVVAVAALGLRVWVGRAVPRLGVANAVATGFGFLILANLLFSVLLRGGASELSYLALLLVGAGAILVSPIWFWVFVVVTVAAVLPVGFALASEAEWVVAIASLAAGTILGAMFHFARVKSYRHIEALRLRDSEHAAELRAALRRVEHELAERLRAEATRRELEEQLRQSQRIEALGILAGGVAHDMNNVLGAITTVASTARDGAVGDDATREDFAQILAAARQGSALTRSLLAFARRGMLHNRRFGLGGPIGEVTGLLARTLPKHVALACDIEPGLDDVVGDAGQLGHVVMNLCLNAADATQTSGTIHVSARNVVLTEDSAALRPGRYVEVAVRDTGVGMSKETQLRVFEPFFTTKGSKDRVGLGLSMVHGTVHQHGGEVTVESALGVGTTVRLLLPSFPATTEQTSPEPPSVVLDPLVHTVLLVDDEPLLRSGGKRMLGSLGVEVHLAKDGREAVEIFGRHAATIDAVVLDLSMPEMGGAECFAHLRHLAPRVPVLVASGYTAGEELDRLLTHQHVGFIAKPFERKAFVRALREVMLSARGPADAA